MKFQINSDVKITFLFLILISGLFTIVTAEGTEKIRSSLAKSLTGNWKNQLGSTLELRCSPSGSLAGYYVTAVGNANGKYFLSGRANLKANENLNKVTLGYSVAWENKIKSTITTTSWTGVYSNTTGNGEPVIETTWVLVSSKVPKWESVLVNQDTFHRVE